MSGYILAISLVTHDLATAHRLHSSGRFFIHTGSATSSRAYLYAHGSSGPLATGSVRHFVLPVTVTHDGKIADGLTGGDGVAFVTFFVRSLHRFTTTNGV